MVTKEQLVNLVGPGAEDWGKPDSIFSGENYHYLP
jgi:hypothetical protein